MTIKNYLRKNVEEVHTAWDEAGEDLICFALNSVRGGCLYLRDLGNKDSVPPRRYDDECKRAFRVSFKCIVLGFLAALAVWKGTAGFREENSQLKTPVPQVKLMKDRSAEDK